MATSIERAHYFRQVSALYTNEGYDRIKRHWKYCNAKESESSPSAAITFVIGGAILGAKIGQELGKQIEKAIVQDSTEGDVGGIIGGSVGLTLGACSGGYAYMHLIECSGNYKKWKSLGLDNSIKQSITYNYSSDDTLKNFCCPVSLCIMDVPAYTPSGVMYDFTFLINCPKEANGYIKDPNKNASFHENNIIIQREMAFVIQKRVCVLMKKDVEQLNSDPLLKASLENQIKNAENSISHCYEHARKLIEKRRKEKTTNSMEYKQEIQDFEKLFGVDESQELDWTLNWNEELSLRWKYFYPNAKTLNTFN